MKRYIALLRGINVGGKNRIAMSELKQDFAGLGFSEVVTYLNSGNVAFSSDMDDEIAISKKIRGMIKDKFSLDIPVLVLLRERLEELLENAPDWWGTDNKEIYHNLIFMMSPLTYAELCERIGSPKEGLESVQHYKNAVFWSFSRKDYQKTNWWSKTASADISAMLTIRTANTVRKIVGM